MTTKVKIIHLRYMFVSQFNRNILMGEMVTPAQEQDKESGVRDTLAKLLTKAKQENLEILNSQDILYKLVATDGYAS